MNAAGAVLTGVAVVGVGAAGYAVYTVMSKQNAAQRQATAPSGYNPYVAQPGYTGYPNQTQPGNPGNNAPPPPKQDDVKQAAQDAAAWIAVAGSVYGLVNNIAGDIGDAVADF